MSCIGSVKIRTIPPVGCKSTRYSSTQHPLPKPFENAWDGIEVIVAGVDVGEQGIELIDDAALFCAGRNSYRISRNSLRLGTCK